MLGSSVFPVRREMMRKLGCPAALPAAEVPLVPRGWGKKEEKSAFEREVG